MGGSIDVITRGSNGVAIPAARAVEAVAVPLRHGVMSGLRSK